jgi:hypothetical protein
MSNIPRNDLTELVLRSIINGAGEYVTDLGRVLRVHGCSPLELAVIAQVVGMCVLDNKSRTLQSQGISVDPARVVKFPPNEEFQ